MMREVIKIQVVKSQLEPDDIGYVRLTQFNEQADSGLRKAIADAEAARPAASCAR